jgi:hypothetical protein
MKERLVHLRPEEFIDIADGAQSESAFPHLAECERCRAELAGVGRTMSIAVDVDVPEPSPLFWPQLSARVGQSIDERIEADANHAWWRVWTRPRVLIPASALAVLVLVVTLAPAARSRWMASSVRTPSIAPAVAPTPMGDPATDSGDFAADPALTLVSDLSANMDLDSASAAGFAEPDSAEHAVTHMTGAELTALKQLLQAEMTRSGA